MLTDQQVRQFDQAGAVTVDSPLTSQQMSAAANAYDRLLPFQEPEPGEQARYRLENACRFFDQELLNLIQHPFFEDVAKQVLNAQSAYFYLAAMAHTHPQPDAEWTFDQHTDVQYCLSDLNATPKRMVCSFFLWISDVNEKRAPLVLRPGSHRLIADWRESNPDLRGVTPRWLVRNSQTCPTCHLRNQCLSLPDPDRSQSSPHPPSMAPHSTWTPYRENPCTSPSLRKMSRSCSPLIRWI